MEDPIALLGNRANVYDIPDAITVRKHGLTKPVIPIWLSFRQLPIGAIVVAHDLCEDPTAGDMDHMQPPPAGYQRRADLIFLQRVPSDDF